MYIKNYLEEFIRVLQSGSSNGVRNRVTVFANRTVDSVTAVHLYKSILRIHDISFSFAPVGNLEELRERFTEYEKFSTYFLLINCGGTVDLLRFFNNPPDKVFFVCDSHRPTNILNIYNETNQIRLIQLDSEQELPAFDQIFRSEVESDSEEDESEEEDESDFIAARRARRAARKAWETERDRIMYHYNLNSYFGTPSSVMALQIAHELSCADIESIWLAIVGLTEYQLLSHYQEHFYNEMVAKLSQMNSVLKNNVQLSRNMLKITQLTDLNFFLYRHWNVYESMKVSCLSKFQVWTTRGESQFHQFLVRVGLPLVECNQNFGNMERNYRKNFIDIILKNWVAGGMEELTYKTFESEIGFNSKTSASDCWWAAFASLNKPDEHGGIGSADDEDLFYLANDTLRRNDKKRFLDGVSLARNYLTALYKQIQASLEMGEVISMGNFLYIVLRKGSVDHVYFNRAETLRFLGNMLLRGLTARKSRLMSKPLLIFAPSGEDNLLGIGIRPMAASPTDNIFGSVFEQAESHLKESYVHHYFDRTIIEIKATGLPKFLQAIIFLMKE